MKAGGYVLEKLKEEVCNANLELVKREVVIYTWDTVQNLRKQCLG